MVAVLVNSLYKDSTFTAILQTVTKLVSNYRKWDRSQLSNIQTDLIEHCGQSARGEYLNTISNTDIATGWWEGAKLKRAIDKKLNFLYQVYQQENRSQKVEPQKKLKPISVINYTTQPEPISVR